MATKTEQDKWRRVDIPFTEGVNEATAVTNLPLSGMLQLNNWRFTKAGDRIEKRDGLGTAIVDTATTGAKDYFGYHTYTDSSSNFCQILVTEDKIWRKVGAAAWASIHTWTTTLAHPVKIYEVQGKQFIMTEIDNRCILEDGTDVQVGITAPATVPTLVSSFASTLLAEDMAVITDWTDDDQGSAASSQATFDSKSTMRLLCTGSSGDIARRYRTVSNIGSEYVIDFNIYFNTVGIYPNNDHFELSMNNGKIKLSVRIDRNDVYVYSGEFWVSCGLTIKQDTWLNFKIYVNSKTEDDEYCEIYKDDVSCGHYNVGELDLTDEDDAPSDLDWDNLSFPCGVKDEANAGKLQLEAYGDTASTDIYIDHLNVADSDGGKLLGVVRYAVTYRRNSGNYPGESNPIKSLVGAATHTGSGLDDMTTGGTYTGTKDRTFRVQIDGTGTPDTIKWSDDEGVTWHAETMAIATTTYIRYGIELTFGATTGHTSGDYWAFTCQSITVSAVHQKVTLSGIPTSSDSQVTQRRLWRTIGNGSRFYFLATINDNTTTDFVDNIPDNALGSAVYEDADIAPTHKFPIWWDDRMWTFDDDENIGYYSRANVPDAFHTNLNTSKRWVSFRYGDSDDKIMGVIPYQSYLYVFKRKSVFFLRKTLGGAYGRYRVEHVKGCIAPWSLCLIGGYIMYLSERGWELFDGCNCMPLEFSIPLNTTFSTIDKSQTDYITSVNYENKNEAWLYMPDRTGGNSAICAVVNYVKGKFYTFTFHKTVSCLSLARNSSSVEKLYVGTRDAYLYEADSGTRDATTSVTATARTGWLMYRDYVHIRRMEIEYEAPSANTIKLDPYMNFDVTSKGQRSLSGSTPATATDRSIRLPIKAFEEFGLRGRYFSLKLVNDENIGSDVKINWAAIYHTPIALKGEIKGD